jgi:PP-loop superfamily ATP-utilizing enzyme
VSGAAVAAAERLLAERGLAGARVTAEGSDGEIAAIRLPEGAPSAVLADADADLAKGIRALGFRYVAVDLD